MSVENQKGANPEGRIIGVGEVAGRQFVPSPKKVVLGMKGRYTLLVENQKGVITTLLQTSRGLMPYTVYGASALLVVTVLIPLVGMQT